MISVQNKTALYVRTLFVLCCFLLVPTSLLAQSAKKDRIDSLINLITKAKEDTAKVILLCSLAQKYPDYDPNKGLLVSKQAIDLAEKLHFDKGIAISNLCAGLNEVSRTEYASAQKYYQRTLEIAGENNFRTVEGLALKDLGICYYEQNNTPESLNSFFKSLHVAEEIHNRKEIFVILEYIGHAYEAQKIYDKAILYFQRSFDSAIAVGENNTRSTAKSLLNIGQVYQESSKAREAGDCYAKALVAFEELHDANGIAFCKAGLGSVYAELHKYGESLKNSHEALKFYISCSDRINTASTLGNIGKLYISLIRDTTGTMIPDSLSNRNKNLDSAFFYLNKSMELSSELTYLEGLVNNYNELSIAWELKGNFKESLKSYRAYIILRDSIYSADNNLKITNLEINREIELKDKQLQLKKLELAKKRNENLFFIFGIFLLLIVTVILYFNFNTQKKLNATISKLVDEQEKTIEARTEALTQSNKKLVDLIQFNVHNLREPITRIMGLLMMRKDVGKEEFFDTCLPMLEQSVNDLDNTLKEVVNTSEQTTK